MKGKRFYAFGALALALLALCCACKKMPEPLAARVEGKRFLVKNGEKYEELFLNGVNLGVAKPGSWPGEYAITYDEYARWLKQMGELGVNTLRVYVIQSPDFYKALYRYNRSHDKPLYLLQGIYMDEGFIAAHSDAYAQDGVLLQTFFSDIREAANAFHGKAEIEPQPGKPSGKYRYDVSDYVVGWILGIEFSADFVLGTNEANPHVGDWEGDYVYTRDASPFEVFLAQAANEAVRYETQTYGCQRPVALCNWVTTDPLSHPNDPDPEGEDRVCVDVEHIRAQADFEAGFFASYHVYPYYPDFFSHQPEYIENGQPYLTYLQELNAYHSLPVLVAEYGVPSSRGVTHENLISGYNQGHMSETEQGETLVALNRDIRKAGMAGALVFAWQDEWFKTTWNTMDYEDTDRRPYWSNAQSSEQNFGLLSFDGGAATLNKDPSEWEGDAPAAQNGGLTLYARGDARYLYLMARGIDEKETLYIALDTIENQGNGAYTKDGLTFSSPADFLVVLSGGEARVLADPYYDLYRYSYAHSLMLDEPVENQNQKDTGRFLPIHMILNKELYLPQTGETVPLQKVETGTLKEGNGDPASPAYDSLADYCYGTDTVELRIPWMLINYADPSTHKVMGDLYENDGFVPQTAPDMGLGLGTGGEIPISRWTYPGWEQPQYTERLKTSYYILQDYFREVGP